MKKLELFLMLLISFVFGMAVAYYQTQKWEIKRATISCESVKQDRAPCQDYTD
jgi:hypothetical protein